MSINLEFTLVVEVDTQEEAELISDAVYSGLAANLVKLGVLYGRFSVSGGGEAVSPAPSPTILPPVSKDDSVKEEDVGTITKVEDRVSSVQKPARSVDAGKRRSSLSGKKRMGRR